MQDDTQEEPTAEEEYDEAWNEISAADDATPEDTQDDVDETETEEETEEEEVEVESDSDAPDDMEKRLSETQKWGHELSAKVKQLEAKLNEQEQGRATQADVDKAQAETDEAQQQLTEAKDSIFKEFPEFQPLLDPLMSTINELQERVSDLSNRTSMSAEQTARDNAINHFESNVKPKVVESVPEFNDIVASEDYWQWASRQRPALQTAAMYSDSPDDIIWAMQEFKKANAGGDIAEEKERQKKQKDKRKTIASSPKPGSKSFGKVNTKDNKNQSYDDAWNDLLKEREKSGGKLPRRR